jgi:hypothetical protein
MEKEQAVQLAHMLEAKGMTDDEIDEYLEHFGVKGMRWGVRRQRRLERLQRVGAGRGSGRDNAIVGLTEVSAVSLGRGGGLRGAARNRAAELQSRRDRIETGQATARDLLMLRGGDRLWVTQ